MENTNPLDIIKRLDIRHNVTIRVLDEATGKVVCEHEGHNAATNSLLTGIAHYLLGDGVLGQGSDALSTWVPQYISVGTMGLTTQDSEEIPMEDGRVAIVPSGIGYTPIAPPNATEEERVLNETLRFEEYVNQTPGYGADGYDSNSNNNREWFGLGYPYSDKPDTITQQYYSGDGITSTFYLDKPLSHLVAITVYPQGVVDPDIRKTEITRQTLSVEDYITQYDTELQKWYVSITNSTVVPQVGSRMAIVYTYRSNIAANCELINHTTLRSKITYRNIIPEVQSEIPNTLDIIYSTFVSTGALAQFRGDRDYIYITEAGLWSRPSFSTSGDNGLLAGYRIMPTDDDVPELSAQDIFTGDGVTTAFECEQKVIDITSVSIDGRAQSYFEFDSASNSVILEEAPSVDSKIVIIYTIQNINSWKDMSIQSNRDAVKKSIIRVGPNQVAQIIWKLQLGGLQQLNGLRYVYPSQKPEEVWYVWQDT